MKIWTSILLVLFLSGCAANFARLSPTEQEAITTATFQADYERTFAAVMQTFQERGFVLRTADKGSGLIDSDYREAYLHGQQYGASGQVTVEALIGKHRSKINATVTGMDDGTTRVRIYPITEMMSGYGNWSHLDLGVDTMRNICSWYLYGIRGKLR